MKSPRDARNPEVWLPEEYAKLGDGTVYDTNFMDDYELALVLVLAQIRDAIKDLAAATRGR